MRQLPFIELDISKLETLWEKSTQVVAWYAHGDYDGTIRGPFCRWFKCTEIEPEYQKHCGSIKDDVEYATAALNSVPHLIAAYRAQSDRIATLEAQLKYAKNETEFYSNRLNQFYE
jgi:hypothetical protein